MATRLNWWARIPKWTRSLALLLLCASAPALYAQAQEVPVPLAPPNDRSPEAQTQAPTPQADAPLEGEGEGLTAPQTLEQVSTAAPETLELRLQALSELGGRANLCLFVFDLRAPAERNYGLIELGFEFARAGERVASLDLSISSVPSLAASSLAIDGPCDSDLLRLARAESQRQGDLIAREDVALLVSSNLAAPLHLTLAEDLNVPEVRARVFLCITQNTNLRAGPSTDRQIVATLRLDNPQEQRVEFLEETGNWSWVLTSSGTGYIFSSLLAPC